MNRELISKKTRNEFREFLVGWTLREIETEFEAANVGCDRAYDPCVGGQRRTLVERHYHTLDFTNAADIRRLLAAYENVLISVTHRSSTLYDRAANERAIENLVSCLKRDGFRYADERITPVTPEARQACDEPASTRTVSEITRHDIFDAVRAGDVSWSGRLSEPEFLSRLYDLDGLPSHDFRFSTAASDIRQHHEVNPEDWPDDWVFTDPRFDLLHSSDEAFLRFLCEMIHPAVRPDAGEVKSLLATFNADLAADGWEISARTWISGKPIYAPRRRILDGSPALLAAKPLVDVLNAEYVTQQIARMEAAVQSDPELAIGTAKEFVETVCKTILIELGETPSSNLDFPQLVKQVREKLHLVPDGIPERARGAETMKRLLSNLGTVAQGLAELRSLYGSGHGKHAKTKGLQPRHARLAIGAASTLAVFLFETYQERKVANP